MLQAAIIRYVWAALVVLAMGWGAVGAAGGQERGPDIPGRFHKGQLLVASPTMGDPRFHRTVIFMIEHDGGGAMGLVVNRVLGSGSMEKFMEGYGLDSNGALGQLRLFYGGPVEMGRGFVLHSNDFKGEHTKVINEFAALTNQKEVLAAMASGNGPRHSRFVLGYSGWGPGQLEREIARKSWEIVPPEETLIFGDDLDAVWDRAIARAGLSL